MHVPGHLVLGSQPVPEQQRVVCAQRHLDAGLKQMAYRHVGGRRGHPERHVGGRADLERDAAGGDPVKQFRVARRRHAVPDAVGMQLVQAGTDAGRARQLAAVRDRAQPCPRGDPEGRPELGDRAAPLVAAEPEAGDPATGVRSGQPGQRARFQRMLGPVGRDDDRHPDPGGSLRRACRIQHKLEHRRQAAEPRCVAGRVDLQLQPARSLGLVVLCRLQQQPVHVSRSADNRPGDVVQPLEAEPPALVGGAELRRPLVGQRLGQVHAVQRGQVDQGRVPHRAGEVQVQVRLRQRGNGPDHAASVPACGTGQQPGPGGPGKGWR